MGGHVHARHKVGFEELRDGNLYRAMKMKHLIISTSVQSFDASIKAIQTGYRDGIGIVANDDFKKTLYALNKDEFKSKYESTG